jgi:hypothetical protein
MDNTKTLAEGSGRPPCYPPSYKHRDGCHNCEFRYQDSGPGVFCQQDGLPTPMEFPNVKDLGEMTIEELEQLADDWDVWTEGRLVEPFGICDLYKRADG